MHKEILTKNQTDLLFIPQMFNKNFGLVGGTAIALQIGHRHSIDFDLFTNKPFSNFNIKKKISKRVKIKNIFKDEDGHYTFIIDDVQFTFFYYPYKLNFSKRFEDIIKMPDILTLAAMKAFALGRRAKWKDYVDLYFVMRKYHGLAKIITRARKIFGGEFNEKLFRSQLVYFKDVSRKEKIVYLKGFEVDDEAIKKELIEFSLGK
jgi:hypothetical protein